MLNRLPVQIPPLWLLLDDIGNPPAKRLAKALDVTERTVKKWIRDDVAPRPVMLSLYWLTRWGQSAVHCEAHNAAVMHAGMVGGLRREIELLNARLDRLGRIADFGAANDPAPNVALPTTPRPRPEMPTGAPARTRQTKPSTTRQTAG